MMKNATSGAGRFHAAKFYESPESLCEVVAEFLSEGFVEHHPALVIGTPEHRAGILAALRARRLDVDRLQSDGELLLLDDCDVLASSMADGMPDATLFTGATACAIEVCRSRQQDRTTRAHGEMVDVVWEAGHDAAAIRVELLWNRLAATHDFSMLCGYAMGVVSAHGSLVPTPRATHNLGSRDSYLSMTER
jgi:MEDS: MEthanogen/methylotroph, DcmR Sensory domain